MTDENDVDDDDAPLEDDIPPVMWSPPGSGFEASP
jgi:hypothetical protein